MIDTYKELLYKNQLELAKLEEKKPEAIFAETIPTYQNPEIKRPSVDPYEIVRYRLTNGQYRQLILVNFDRLPDWLRGSTDDPRRMDINETDYEPYDVMAHEMTHITRPNEPEYWVRAYAPRGIRSFEEFKARFPEFDFLIVRRL